jgi:hypothetical protein
MPVLDHPILDTALPASLTQDSGHDPAPLFVLDFVGGLFAKQVICRRCGVAGDLVDGLLGPDADRVSEFAAASYAEAALGVECEG